MSHSHGGERSLRSQAGGTHLQLLLFLPTVFLAALIVALLSSMPAVAASPTQAVDQFEVQSYQEDFGVSAQTAERNLAIQQRALGVVEGLEHAQGKSYAGVWFDNESGEFVVPLLETSSPALVDKILADTNIGTNFRITQAQYSWAELEAAQEQIDKSLFPLVEHGLVQTLLDSRTNAVVIREAESVSETDKSELHQTAASQDVKVEVRQSGNKRFDVKTMCKTTAPRGCNPPLRGGVAMSPLGKTYPG
jgi:hypothetical protein